eukprot:2659001-Alexandrium_andersonii.AAC.1
MRGRMLLVLLAMLCAGMGGSLRRAVRFGMGGLLASRRLLLARSDACLHCVLRWPGWPSRGLVGGRRVRR